MSSSGPPTVNSGWACAAGMATGPHLEKATNNATHWHIHRWRSILKVDHTCFWTSSWTGTGTTSGFIARGIRCWWDMSPHMKADMRVETCIWKNRLLPRNISQHGDFRRFLKFLHELKSIVRWKTYVTTYVSYMPPPGSSNR